MRKSVRDFRFGPLLPHCSCSAELLFEVFSQRYECGSTIVTSNLPFEEWPSVFQSERLTGALLDRLAGTVRQTKIVSESTPTRFLSGRAELTPCGQRGGAAFLENGS